MILVAEADGSIRFETPSTEAVLGYTLEAANDLSLAALLHPDDAENAAALIEAMLAGISIGPDHGGVAVPPRTTGAGSTWR